MLANVLLVLAAAFGAALFFIAAGNVARARKEDRLHQGWTLENSGWRHDDLT